MENDKLILKWTWRFLQKLGIKPPYDPAISLLGIYPEETKIEKDTCTPTFTAALLTIARTRKQPRCPSTRDWIKQLRDIYTVEYYSARKRNAFESVLMRWMKLEPIILSEVSQREKHQYKILMHIYGIQCGGTEVWPRGATPRPRSESVAALLEQPWRDTPLPR